MKDRTFMLSKEERAQNELETVLAYLKEANIRFSKPHPHQIKIGPISFYPSTGTIVEDGRGRREEHGAEGLIAILDGFASVLTPIRWD